jgi:PTH2 family peptidyl-tRNA hydrolase
VSAPASDELKLAIAVRGDVAMSPGKVAAQAAHAAVTAALEAERGQLRAWLEQGQPKVVLRLRSTDDLEAMLARAHEHAVPVTPIHDAGRTEVQPGTLTVVAFGPAARDAVDAVTGMLPLY